MYLTIKWFITVFSHCVFIYHIIYFFLFSLCIYEIVYYYSFQSYLSNHNYLFHCVFIYIIYYYLLSYLLHLLGFIHIAYLSIKLFITI